MPTEREKRKANREKCALWRDQTRLRPDTRVTDRILLEAVCVAIGDRAIIDASTAQALGNALLHGAQAGLLRLGYDLDLAREALAARLGAHAGTTPGTAVKPALRDGWPLRSVRKVRQRRPSECPATPPL